MPLGEEAKRFIMEEITRQMEPTHTLLQTLKEWQLAFWSNGSGRPPGFFQSRIQHDDDRYGRLKTESEAQSVVLGDVKSYMIEQRAVRVERERADTDRQKRHARYWMIGKIAAGLLGTALAWGAKEAYPVVKILIEDYLHSHPYVSEKLKNKAANQLDPVYANRQNSADLPSQYQPR